MNERKRWGIAIAAILVQMALGAVYAWSVFRVPLSKLFHSTISEVTLVFTIAIFVLGFAAFFGGLWLSRVGPRVVVVTGGLLYGGGIFLASFSSGLPWLYLTYGVIGGIGLGFGYIVPISVLVKWFPDRRGLMTGVAVGGFGAGALVTAPVATRLIQSVGVLHTFAYLGIAYLIVTCAAGWFMTNPPAGWQPAGWTPGPTEKAHRAAKDFHLGEALKTWQWWALWLLLFLNTSAGISIISQEAPMFPLRETSTGVPSPERSLAARSTAPQGTWAHDANLAGRPVLPLSAAEPQLDVPPPRPTPPPSRSIPALSWPEDRTPVRRLPAPLTDRRGRQRMGRAANPVGGSRARLHITQPGGHHASATPADQQPCCSVVSAPGARRDRVVRSR